MATGSSLPRKNPYVLFLHGTTWDTKHWPEAYWRELAERMGSIWRLRRRRLLTFFSDNEGGSRGLINVAIQGVAEIAEAHGQHARVGGELADLGDQCIERTGLGYPFYAVGKPEKPRVEHQAGRAAADDGDVVREVGGGLGHGVSCGSAE